MIGVVLPIMYTFGQCLPCPAGVIRPKIPHFGGGMTTCGQKNIFPASGTPGEEIKEFILLLIDERVIRLTKRMSIQAILPFGVIFGRIEDGSIIRRPDYGADFLDGIRQEFSGAKILNI